MYLNQILLNLSLTQRVKPTWSLGTTVEFYANTRDGFYLPKYPYPHSVIHHSNSAATVLEQMVVSKIHHNPWLMGGSTSLRIIWTLWICITYAIQHLSDNNSLLCWFRTKLLTVILSPNKIVVLNKYKAGVTY